MVKIIKIEPIGFAANAYLLTADGQNAVAIDPSQPRVIAEAEKRGLKIGAVLLTHGHFDHVGACNELYRRGVPIYCPETERALALGEDSLWRAHGAPMPAFEVKTLRGGDRIELCGVLFTVIATPGHTAGSATYRTGEHLFTGDTLFRGCVGRTDLPTGDEVAIVQSVKKLYALGDAFVHPGHDEDTTLAFEKKYNVCVRGE